MLCLRIKQILYDPSRYKWSIVLRLCAIMTFTENKYLLSSYALTVLLPYSWQEMNMTLTPHGFQSLQVFL